MTLLLPQLLVLRTKSLKKSYRMRPPHSAASIRKLNVAVSVVATQSFAAIAK